jgi:hypothetical protein
MRAVASLRKSNFIIYGRAGGESCGKEEVDQYKSSVDVGGPAPSEKRSKTLPRVFTTAPLRCQALNKRLTVNSVRLAAAAKSSLVTSISRPPGTF